jgi:hypothetical protein
MTVVKDLSKSIGQKFSMRHVSNGRTTAFRATSATSEGAFPHRSVAGFSMFLFERGTVPSGPVPRVSLASHTVRYLCRIVIGAV